MAKRRLLKPFARSAAVLGGTATNNNQHESNTMDEDKKNCGCNETQKADEGSCCKDAKGKDESCCKSEEAKSEKKGHKCGCGCD